MSERSTPCSSIEYTWDRGEKRCVVDWGGERWRGGKREGERGDGQWGKGGIWGRVVRVLF